MIDQIVGELKRLEAARVQVRLDERFEPQAGTLVEARLEGAYWHLLPGEFLQLLQDLPDGAGEEAIRRAIESQAVMVWHGPSPPDSRDTSA